MKKIKKKQERKKQKWNGDGSHIEFHTVQSKVMKIGTHSQNHNGNVCLWKVN